MRPSATQRREDVRAKEPRILAIDAGGTMTDTFIVDDAGAFVVGKAQTTPEDESEGFLSSSTDALAYLAHHHPQGFPAWSPASTPVLPSS